MAELRREIDRAVQLIAYASYVGNHPDGICCDGANIWVANYWDNSVTKLRAADGATMGTFDVRGAGPYTICFDGHSLWVANHLTDSVGKLTP